MRHVPQRLAGKHVQLVDYGIRGMHLAYDLLDGCDALVLIDAIPNNGAPGTVHVFEADHESLAAAAGLDAHAMDPGAVFATLNALGGTPPYTIVIGCEIANTDDGIGLSDAVANAVPDAVRAVEDVLSDLLSRTSVGKAEPCVWESRDKSSTCWRVTATSSPSSTSRVNTAR
jgi:hydrogenase maturation protease